MCALQILLLLLLLYSDTFSHTLYLYSDTFSHTLYLYSDTFYHTWSVVAERSSALDSSSGVARMWVPILCTCALIHFPTLCTCTLMHFPILCTCASLKILHRASMLVNDVRYRPLSFVEIQLWSWLVADVQQASKCDVRSLAPHVCCDFASLAARYTCSPARRFRKLLFHKHMFVDISTLHRFSGFKINILAIKFNDSKGGLLQREGLIQTSTKRYTGYQANKPNAWIKTGYSRGWCRQVLIQLWPLWRQEGRKVEMCYFVSHTGHERCSHTDCRPLRAPSIGWGDWQN